MQHRYLPIPHRLAFVAQALVLLALGGILIPACSDDAGPSLADSQALLQDSRSEGPQGDAGYQDVSDLSVRDILPSLDLPSVESHGDTAGDLARGDGTHRDATSTDATSTDATSTDATSTDARGDGSRRDATGADATYADATYVHQDISPQAFYQKLQAGASFTIIDVREPSEFATGHLLGAINQPWISAVLQKNYSALPKGLPYAVICQSGGRSDAAATFLTKQGLAPVFDILGGTGAWIAAGLPVVK